MEKRPLLKTPVVKLILFLLFAVAAFPLSGMAIGMLGLSGPIGAPWFGAALALALLAATILCARLNGERLSELGFRVTRADVLAVPLAFLAGAVTFLGALLVLGIVSGGTWQANAAATMRTAATGLVLVLCLFLAEELLFRGYAFQQLKRRYGSTIAVSLSAVLFGAYHLIGSGDWAMGAVFRFLMPTLGGLVFGYALVRTGSLAVPLGLHWGGNWLQSVILGLGHTPGNSQALWIMPLDVAQVRAVTAPDLLPHLPYIVALSVMFLFVRALPQRDGLTTT